MSFHTGTYNHRSGIWQGLVAGFWTLIGIGIVIALYTKLNAPAEAHPVDQPIASLSKETRHEMATQLYLQNCAVCHGVKGDGKGIVAAMLNPQPRNFNLGQYRWITSGNNAPFREDIHHTIRNGLAGTSMPAWQNLNDDQIELLTDYVLGLTRANLEKDLVAKKLKPKVVAALLDGRLTAKNKVQIPPEPQITSAHLARGKEIYLSTCAKCHNDDGSGRADPTWVTAEGFPIASRNFTSSVFKGGGKGTDIYTRIYAGMPGTPMASFSSYPPADIWAIVHYVQTLADTKARSLNDFPNAPTTAPSTAK